MKTYITRLTLQGFKSFNRKISIPFFPGLIEITGPNGSGKCVAGDTLVQLADGSLKTIRELVENALEKAKKVEKLDDGFLTRENPENVYVLSLNPLTLKIEKRKVSAFIKRKAPKWLLKIRTRTGKEIIATEYHPFFTLDNGILVPVGAEKLKVGIKVATPRTVRINDARHNTNIFGRFEVEDNIYISNCEGKKNFYQKSRIPDIAMKWLLDGQSINVTHPSRLMLLEEYAPEIRWLKSKTYNKKLKIAWLTKFFGCIIAEGRLLFSFKQVGFVNNEPFYKLTSSDIFWDEIVSIKKIRPKEKWVYDLCIEDTHNFIANNFIVHNSNIIDAISFVLGRTSAKSLRADRLHELIFRGTETKKPAEYASVTLYLDNSQKVFPFEDKEISITRKVNKKGYVVYKLNGKTTTREKILEVLSLANIRPDGYNIIQQGDVTRVLEMNPVERREIIDEICGIAEYNEKKEKALRDLEVVDQKLREVEIIVTQKYEIFKKLEEERNKAIKYQELQKQLTILQASYWKKKVEVLNEKLNKTLENISKIKEKIDEVDNEIKEKEQRLEEIEKTNAEIVKKIIELSKRFKVEEEASRIRSRLMIVRERIETNRREAERLQNLIDEMEKLEIKKAEFAREMSRAVREILNLKLRGVYGTIADLISVPEEYKAAIEVAAAQHLYDIVVENEDIAIMCIDFLKREKIGRATFLPLNKIKPQEFKEKELLDREGVIGIASKVINYDRKFSPAIEFVFGNTLIVDSLQTAKEIGIGKVRMVTLDGDLIERSGAITGGYLIKEAKKEKEKISVEEYRKLRLQLLSEIEELKKEEEELERKLKELSASEESKEMISLEKIRIASQKEVERLREARRKLQDRRINLEIEMNRLAIDKAKIETELENAKKEYEKFVGIETIDESLNVLEERLKKVEAELRAIGIVNLKAIEEYETLKKEFDALKEKYERVLEEKKAVLKMIDEIDNKRREVFLSTLEKVSKEFNDVINKMVGGEGYLTLEDVNNLESGLLIKVKLPDKGEVEIDSLSGGEKSIVALAFLFALQRYKPSPFYLMDEIDAALDKENSLKVAKWLKEASKESQFIIITHNDITLKFADKIYGCTLEEGETKILSVELPRE